MLNIEMKTINTGINTDSFITGYSRTGRRPVRHLRIEDDASFVKVYAIGNQIGKGTFGTVFEVRDMKDNKTWATKVIEKKSTPMQSLKILEREINILKVLNHPHIISLREVFESASKIYLIMEKCLSDLMKLTRDENMRFTESNVRPIINDLTSAITYLHKNDIVHRDVKMENVLVTNNPNNVNDHMYIKLSDFGLSIVKSGHGIANMLNERCGTLQYMSPEILQSKSYSQQCDVWSIGVITYYILSLQMPFTGKTEAEIITNICSSIPQPQHFFSPELRDLIGRVLNKDPAARITAAELLNHPWLKGKKLIDYSQSHNVIDMMRLCNKDMRISLDDETDDELLYAPDQHKRSAAAVSVKNVRFDKRNKRASNMGSKRSRGQGRQDDKSPKRR